MDRRREQPWRRNMGGFQAGDIVAFKLDDGDQPGLAKARVVRPTRFLVTGQAYLIEILGLIRPSPWRRAPRVGSKREVVERHLAAAP
jgi:hypothetical protein